MTVSVTNKQFSFDNFLKWRKLASILADLFKDTHPFRGACTEFLDRAQSNLKKKHVAFMAAQRRQALTSFLQGLDVLNHNTRILPKAHLGNQSVFLCSPYFALKIASPTAQEDEETAQQIFDFYGNTCIVPHTLVRSVHREHFGMSPMRLLNHSFLLRNVTLPEKEAILKNLAAGQQADACRKLFDLASKKDIVAVQDAGSLNEADRKVFQNLQNTMWNILYKDQAQAVSYFALLRIWLVDPNNIKILSSTTKQKKTEKTEEKSSQMQKLGKKLENLCIAETTKKPIDAISLEKLKLFLHLPFTFQCSELLLSEDPFERIESVEVKPFKDMMLFFQIPNESLEAVLSKLDVESIHALLLTLLVQFTDLRNHNIGFQLKSNPEECHVVLFDTDKNMTESNRLHYVTRQKDQTKHHMVPVLSALFDTEWAEKALPQSVLDLFFRSILRRRSRTLPFITRQSTFR